jgi:hypothetical protein
MCLWDASEFYLWIHPEGFTSRKVSLIKIPCPRVQYPQFSADGSCDFQFHDLAVLLFGTDKEAALRTEVGETGVLSLRPRREDADSIIDTLQQEFADGRRNTDAFNEVKSAVRHEEQTVRLCKRFVIIAQIITRSRH